MRKTLFATLAAMLALTAGSSGGAQQGAAAIGAGADWTAPGGAADEAGFSRLTQLTPGTVRNLGLAFAMDLPEEVTLQSTPLAIGGTLYFSGGYAEVYAVDARSGQLKWKFDPETWKRRPDKLHFGANRGIAFEDGRIFTAEMDGTVDALDPATGKVLWSAPTIPADAPYNNSTGAPRTMNGKVIIGNGGADAGGRGFVTALDAKTGKFLWRFYTVPGSAAQNALDPALQAAAKTWSPEFFKKGGGGGGTVWNGMTFDPELNRIYLGVGNAGPYDSQARDPGGGDNLYTSSIVALDADSGKYAWHYQENPRDSWDYKAAPNIVMATIAIDGSPRKVLLHAPTNGFFYVLDRATGKFLSAGKTTVINWASGIDPVTGRPIENPNIRLEKGRMEIWPGTIGGHNWQAMSFSPRTGLVYIPVHQIGALFSRDPADQGDDGVNIMGTVVRPLVKKPGDGMGKLVAWDPVRQREAWSVQHSYLWNGGTLATEGGLVFQGMADGWFKAWDARTGRELWKFNAGLGIIAAPMSFAVDGEQYVAVLVGWGGTTAAMSGVMDVGWKYGMQPRRLLVFKLGGKARLARSPPRTMRVDALDDPDLVIDPADAQMGKNLSIMCMSCHGAGFRGAGSPGPDLRESGVALQLDSFGAFIKAGNLAKGMPSYAWLNDKQIKGLHAYLRHRAREQLGKAKPLPPGPPAGPRPKAGL